jgi:hypothetical protein
MYTVFNFLLEFAKLYLSSSFNNSHFDWFALAST